MTLSISSASITKALSNSLVVLAISNAVYVLELLHTGITTFLTPSKALCIYLGSHSATISLLYTDEIIARGVRCALALEHRSLRVRTQYRRLVFWGAYSSEAIGHNALFNPLDQGIESSI